MIDRRWWCLSLMALAMPSACSGSSAKTSDVADVPRPPVAAATTPAARLCEPNDDDGTVTIWHSMGGPAATDLWAALEAEFDATHQVQLDLVDFDGDQAVIDNLAETQRADWPDLVDVSEQDIQTFLDSNQFLMPEECDPAIADDLLPLIRATYSVNNELVALPFAVSTPVLIFDAAEFRKAGLDPNDPPLTWTELMDTSRVLADSGVSPYGLVMTDWCANLVVDQFSAKRGVPTGGAENGHDTQPVTVDYATAANIADLSALADGVVAGSVKYLGGSENNLNDLLELSNTTERGGSMAVHTSGALGDVVRLLPNYPGVELGVGPLPGPGPGALVGGNAMWLAANDDAQQVGRAWSVLDWLYQPERISRWAIEAGFVPPTDAATHDPALVERWEQYPQLKVAYDQIVATPVSAASAGMLIGPFAGRSRVLYEVCNKILRDGADIAATLQAASVAVNELIRQYAEQRDGTAATPPPSTTTPSVVAEAVDISGTVECASGAAVVGVFVVGETTPDANNGWANFDGTGASKVGYQFTLRFGGRYQLHVGCGGTGQDWGSESFTMFVSNSSDFLCHDDPPQRGVCDTL